MIDLPSAISRVYAMAEIGNWHTRISPSKEGFKLGRTNYDKSIALIFKKRNHVPAAMVWLVSDEGKVSYDGGFLKVLLSGYPVDWKIQTQKEVLAYLSGDVTSSQMKEKVLDKWKEINEKWNSPMEEPVKKNNCPGCSMCSKAWKKKLAAPQSDPRRA